MTAQENGAKMWRKGHDTMTKLIRPLAVLWAVAVSLFAVASFSGDGIAAVNDSADGPPACSDCSSGADAAGPEAATPATLRRRHSDII